MRPKVSIIIPVYNVEKYLCRCLDSIINQSLKDIEIILVDDGSQDNCGKICDDYASTDNRIRVIHKKNAGVSSARNSGLEIASGEYIGFVDADDFAIDTMFEVLYSQAVLFEADISMCHFFRVDAEHKLETHKKIPGPENIKKLNSRGAIDIVLDFNQAVQVAVWNKLFKRSVLRQLKFDVNKKMSEDFEFLIQAIIKSQTIICIPQALYGYYVQREGSATFCGKSVEWYGEQNAHIASIVKIINEFDPELRNIAIGYKCVNGSLSLANGMVYSGKLEISAVKQIRDEFIENLPMLMRSKLHMIKKIQILLFVFNPQLYQQFMRKYFKFS